VRTQLGYGAPMKIEADTVVSIDYTLKNDQGQVLDTSDGHSPLFYLHGHSNIVEGLESALGGRTPGDSLDVVVPPEQGYGERKDDLVFDVPREQLPKDVSPRKGMQLSMTSDDGHTVPVLIRTVKPRSVEVDANHELAGVTLHFSVVVREVRRATQEELHHGHAHGPGGHHHH
jgi:FKBP-type peptidyl-prolyl cis-trans isomerase SlyD